MKVYIVIRFKRLNVGVLDNPVYDDSTEKYFIEEDNQQSPTPSEKYEEYLRLTSKEGDEVIRTQVALLQDISIDELYANDAKNRLTFNELNALTQNILNSNKL